MAIYFIEVKDNQTKTRKLCETLQHHYIQGHSILVLAPSDEAARYVDELLWRYPKESFLPHQIIQKPASNKVAITKVQENLNKAQILFNLCPQASPHCEQFETVYEFQDGTTPEKLQQSKERKAFYENKGLKVAFSESLQAV